MSMIIMTIMMNFVTKLIRVHIVKSGHVIFETFTCRLKYMLDLRDGYHREIFCKKEETGKEQSKCSHIKSDLPNRRAIVY